MANPKRPPSREVRRLREELRRLMERWDAVIRREMCIRDRHLQCRAVAP